MDRHSPPSGKASPKGASAFKIIRAALSAVFTALAVVFFILSAFSSALWKSRSEISASLSSSSLYLVSVPGLLSLTGSRVKVAAFSSSPVCVAIAQSADAQGWVGSSPYVQINGLSSWKNLRSRPLSGSQSYPDKDPVPFQDSDMWEKVDCGRQPDFEWEPGPDQSLILFNPAQRNVDLVLGWKRVKIANLTAPYAFLGCVSLLLAAVSLEFSRLKEIGSKEPPSPLPSPQTPAPSPRWAQDQLAAEKRKARVLPRTVKSTKIFKIREKTEEDEVSTQVMDLSALRGMQVALEEDPKALKPSLFGSEPPSFPVASSPLAAGTVFSVTSSKESDPASKKKGPAIVDKSSVNLLAKPGSQDQVQLHPKGEDLGAYFERLKEEKRGEKKHEKKA
ncbi:MAG: hypothetical protein IKT06_03375 [Aeriscardovia sp.]|nr:hypothetical protein [Aeriscardovia sp.]